METPIHQSDSEPNGPRQEDGLRIAFPAEANTLCLASIHEKEDEVRLDRVDGKPTRAGRSLSPQTPLTFESSDGIGRADLGEQVELWDSRIGIAKAGPAMVVLRLENGSVSEIEFEIMLSEADVARLKRSSLPKQRPTEAKTEKPKPQESPKAKTQKLPPLPEKAEVPKPAPRLIKIKIPPKPTPSPEKAMEPPAPPKPAPAPIRTEEPLPAPPPKIDAVAAEPLPEAPPAGRSWRSRMAIRLRWQDRLLNRKARSAGYTIGFRACQTWFSVRSKARSLVRAVRIMRNEMKVEVIETKIAIENMRRAFKEWRSRVADTVGSSLSDLCWKLYEISHSICNSFKGLCLGIRDAVTRGWRATCEWTSNAAFKLRAVRRLIRRKLRVAYLRAGMMAQELRQYVKDTALCKSTPQPVHARMEPEEIRKGQSGSEPNDQKTQHSTQRQFAAEKEERMSTKITGVKPAQTGYVIEATTEPKATSATELLFGLSRVNSAGGYDLLVAGSVIKGPDLGFDVGKVGSKEPLEGVTYRGSFQDKNDASTTFFFEFHREGDKLVMGPAPAPAPSKDKAEQVELSDLSVSDGADGFKLNSSSAGRILIVIQKMVKGRFETFFKETWKCPAGNIFLPLKDIDAELPPNKPLRLLLAPISQGENPKVIGNKLDLNFHVDNDGKVFESDARDVSDPETMAELEGLRQGQRPERENNPERTPAHRDSDRAITVHSRGLPAWLWFALAVLGTILLLTLTLPVREWTSRRESAAAIPAPGPTFPQGSFVPDDGGFRRPATTHAVEVPAANVQAGENVQGGMAMNNTSISISGSNNVVVGPLVINNNNQGGYTKTNIDIGPPNLEQTNAVPSQTEAQPRYVTPPQVYVGGGSDFYYSGETYGGGQVVIAPQVDPFGSQIGNGYGYNRFCPPPQRRFGGGGFHGGGFHGGGGGGRHR